MGKHGRRKNSFKFVNFANRLFSWKEESIEIFSEFFFSVFVVVTARNQIRFYDQQAFYSVGLFTSFQAPRNQFELGRFIR